MTRYFYSFFSLFFVLFYTLLSSNTFFAIFYLFIFFSLKGSSFCLDFIFLWGMSFCTKIFINKNENIIVDNSQLLIPLLKKKKLIFQYKEINWNFKVGTHMNMNIILQHYIYKHKDLFYIYITYEKNLKKWSACSTILH